MTTIEIIIRDKDGNIINEPEKRKYQLNIGNSSFNDIEGAVESFKKIALPDISSDLLNEAQANFVKDKKTVVSCNGKIPVKIKSLQGSLQFNVQRFKMKDTSEEEDVTYFDLTNQFKDGYISDRLKEFSSYYSNRLSYEDVEELIKRTTGEKQLSDQKIRGIVVDKARELSKEIEKEVKRIIEDESLQMPEVNVGVDIYDPEEDEILLFDDGIQVKGQKENRQRIEAGSIIAISDECENKRIRVNSNVIMLEKKEGGFEYIAGVIDEAGEELIPLEQVVKSKIIKEYGEKKGPLNFVAITDGAKDIRLRLLSIFGIVITIILDWYHLVKKVRELMSMIAINKEEKLIHLKFLFYNLWRGMTDEALGYLKTEVKAKNEKKLDELIRYIEKHKEEIIDYSSRKESGKTIGSGRVEKGCDQVIGNRQKKKGMSWGKQGSRSLGILKVVELNNEWEKTWFPEEAANSEANSSFQLPLAANM